MIKNILVPIFDIEVFVFTTRKDCKNVTKMLDMESLLHVYDRTSGFVASADGCPMLICISDTKHPHVVAHECAHLAYNIQQKTGINFNDEVNAYLIDYLFKTISKIINPKKHKKHA